MKRLIYEDRLAIQKGLQEEKSFRKLQKELGIPKSTIFYEVKRYSRYYDNKNIKYNALSAQISSEETRKRFKVSQRKVEDSNLLDAAEKYLKKRFSPYHAATALRNKGMYISHETIYHLIFSFKSCEGHKCVNGINIF